MSTQKRPIKAVKKAAPPTPKNKGGRPSAWRDEFEEQAYRLCLLGATDDDLAAFFHVAKATLNNWKGRHPGFMDAIKRGRELPDSEVALSLYKRATGYIGKKTVTATFEGLISDTKVVDDYVGPDVAACIFWLKNRRPAQWRDRPEPGQGNDAPPAVRVVVQVKDARKAPREEASADA